MPTPSTYQSAGMKVFDGLSPGVDGNGFIADIAYKVKVVAKTAAYTVSINDSGTYFTTRGATAAVTFTLPSAATGQGCIFWFFSAVDFAMTVAGATGELIAKNDVAANSVAFSTASEIIGGAVKVVGDGTSWLVFPESEELVTITVAT